MSLIPGSGPVFKGGNPRKARGSQNQQAAVRVKVDADTKDSLQKVKQMEQSIKQLQRLQNTGQTWQDGFLSTKQVKQFQQLVQQMTKVQQEYANKVQQAQSQVDKHQDNYNSAQARGANPKVVDHHRKRLDEANDKLEEMQKSKARVDARMEASKKPIEDIGNMTKLNGGKYSIYKGVKNLTHAAGMVMGPGQLVGYTGSGIRLADAQEHNVWDVAQKMGGYGGDYRQTIWDLQNGGQNFKYGYDTNQIIGIQRQLMAGGTDGTRSLSDNEAVQQFSRAEGITDPNSVASGYASVRRLGGSDEGDMKKFGQIIGGEIAKVQGQGRENEIYQASVGLINQVGSNQASMSSQQVGNIVGLQAMLGQADKGLLGQRGANQLANLDSSIKGGSQNMDIMLGWGSRYTGISGYWQMMQQKAKGISDPENLRMMMQTLQQSTGGNKDEMKILLSSEGGLDPTVVQKMDQSGMLDKLANGNIPSAADLQRVGAIQVDKNSKDYQSSWMNKEDSANAMLDKTKSDMGVPLLRIGQEAKSLWSDMPEWAQMAGVVAGGLGGYKLARGAGSLIGKGIKWASPSVNGSGGLINGVKNWFGKGGGGSSGGGLLNTVKGWFGGSGDATLGKISSKTGMLATGEEGIALAGSKFLGPIGAAISAMWPDTVGMSPEDEKAAVQKYSQMPPNTPDQRASSLSSSMTGQPDPKVDSLNARDININNQSLSDIMKSAFKGDGTSGMKVQHEVTVTVKGGIDGMNAENQDGVRNDFHEYFKGLLSNQLQNGVDLSNSTKTIMP